MTEVWKHINGYEDYMVSNLGRVKSLKCGKERILTPRKTGRKNNQYFKVHLLKNGIINDVHVHRLVAVAFLENPENLPCVNHIDQNTFNNNIGNLEFCTHKYNIRYSKARKIGCYSNGKLIKVYDCIQDVDKDGFYHQNVCHALKGRYKSSGGFQWKYLN